MPIPANPLVTIDKSTDATVVAEGDVVSFTLVVTNTGDVTLTNVIVTDPLAAVTCPMSALAVGESMTCTATLTITAELVAGGELRNVATANGISSGGTVVDASDEVLVPVATAAISLDKSASVATVRQGQSVTYTFEVTNTGQVPLTGLTIDDPLTGPVACPTTTLAVGQSTTCTASYVATGTDAAAGMISNTATASASGPAGEPALATDTVITLVEQPASPPTAAPAPDPGPVGAPPPPPIPPTVTSPPLAQTGGNSPFSVAMAITLLALGGLLVVGGRRALRSRG